MGERVVFGLSSKTIFSSGHQSHWSACATAQFDPSPRCPHSTEMDPEKPSNWKSEKPGLNVQICSLIWSLLKVICHEGYFSWKRPYQSIIIVQNKRCVMLCLIRIPQSDHNEQKQKLFGILQYLTKSVI